MIEFATPENTKQPTGGLLREAPHDQDHVFGATGPDLEVLTDGHWSPFAPPHVLQRNRLGQDTFFCVSFSLNSNHSFIFKKRYNEVLDKSERFLALASGTERGRGVSKRTVADFNRTGGFVSEADCPFTPDMTLDQVYSPLDQALFPKAKLSLDQYEFAYQWLWTNNTPDNSAQALRIGLQYSPVQVDVEGRYVYGPKGYIVNAGNDYTHEVDIFDFEQGVCWWVFDSESAQVLKFDWLYDFGSPMIHSIKKKFMVTKYKIKGNAAVFQLDPVSNVLVPYGSGEVYKLLQGTLDYQGIVEVENLEELEKIAPLADWIVTRAPWDKTSFVNSLI